MAGFVPLNARGETDARVLPLAASQTIYLGDLVTWSGTAVEAISGATEGYCGVAAESPLAGATEIRVYTDPDLQFQAAASSAPTTAVIGHDYAPTTTPGSQTVNLLATGLLRVSALAGTRVVVSLVNHQFSANNESEGERVPEPSTAGVWLRKVLAGVGSWVAGVPTITGTTGHIPKIKSDGTLETAGIAAANLQVLTVPAADHTVAALTATGALETSGVLTANVMRRPASATAGDVATMTSAKDAEGSGLQLNSVARRAGSPTAGHLATLDADGDPTDSGIVATAVQQVLGSGALDVVQANATTGAMERSGLTVAGVMRRPATATTGNLAVFDNNDDVVDGGAVPNPTIRPFDNSNSTDFNVAATGGIYVATAVPNPITATLPATSAAGLGRVITFKKMGPGANSLTIVPHADDLPVGGPADGIDGAASLVMTVDLSFVTLVCSRVKAGAVVGAWQVIG